METLLNNTGGLDLYQYPYPLHTHLPVLACGIWLLPTCALPSGVLSPAPLAPPYFMTTLTPAHPL